ncbi:hypothetical protein [Pseudomonas sp. WS 5011]|uniref:hypothetical protein n=1 Tax=Pseudomonas sp. WS 5011 TaxID=2717477 RepID=UPI0014750CC5|nr:hypothetical protein [Pseudomonas sp. WS 5011]NMY53404.1 hypothetical protein [Pseudomonas sp. WS 5011]
MSYLAKSLTPDQEIVVQLSTTADRDDVARRLSLDGIRLKVLGMAKFGLVKVGVMAPQGLTPESRDFVYLPKGGVGRLVLTRSLGGEVVVTLREGADADVVLDWLASDGLVFQVTGTRTNQCRIGILAINELLVLRDELCLGA